MTNYVSYLLAANAAKRRLAELFESGTLGPADYRSATIVAGDRNSASWTTTEQNNNVREYSRSQRRPDPDWARTAIPTKASDRVKRDLTVSGLVFALLFSGVVTAAYTDQPVFWLLVGPAPFAVAYTLRTSLRRPLVRREGLLVLCEPDR